MQYISFKWTLPKVEDLYWINEFTDHGMGGGGLGDIALIPRPLHFLSKRLCLIYSLLFKTKLLQYYSSVCIIVGRA